MSHPRNAVLEMFQEAQERTEERARDLTEQEAALREADIECHAIKSLADAEGWPALMKMVEQKMTTLRAQFESQMEPHEFAHLQGQLVALKWLSLIPSLAEVRLVALQKVAETLSAEAMEFIETGA